MVVLFSVLIGVVASSLAFALLFGRNSHMVVNRHTPTENLRRRYVTISTKLMSASRKWFGGASSQAKYLDQERQLLCLLSTKPCAPFPASWEDKLESGIEKLISSVVSGSRSQDGIMNQIKSGLQKDPTGKVKYSAWQCTKQSLKDFGNDILNDGKGDVNYLGHKWNQDPESKKPIGTGKSLKRVHLIIKKALPVMRRGPISVLEITMDCLDNLLDEYFAFQKNGTVKFIFKSLSFRRKANLLYSRIDQCFAVMPLWFLQIMNMVLESVKCLKDTKLPYELSVLNKPLTYNIFQDRVFRMVDDYSAVKGKNSQPKLVNESIKKPGWFWSFMLKTLMASNISQECRKEIRRKNRDPCAEWGSSRVGLSVLRVPTRFWDTSRKQSNIRHRKAVLGPTNSLESWRIVPTRGNLKSFLKSSSNELI